MLKKLQKQKSGTSSFRLRFEAVNYGAFIGFFATFKEVRATNVGPMGTLYRAVPSVPCSVPMGTLKRGRHLEGRGRGLARRKFQLT